MAVQIIPVNIDMRSYPLYLGYGVLQDPQYLRKHILADQVMIVSNETVAPLYLAHITKLLEGLQCEHITLADGEEYKNLQTASTIFDALLEKKFRRNSTLIALGGGVVGDITGFVAACYQRGINFIQIPTTLLAQVDAAIGGKTAVNHPLGKNMIGAFHQPSCVIIDPSVLSTLTPREYRAGFAEVIKHALIRDANFFHELTQQVDNLLAQEQEFLGPVIAKASAIKAEVVSIDEQEQGLRAILNFGHTVAHAIESGLGYGHWHHGEAVAVGMCVAAELSHRMGKLSAQVLDEIEQFLTVLQLPTRAPAQLSIDQCINLMVLDKKNTSTIIRFVLLERLGRAVISDDVPMPLLREVLRDRGFGHD